jgi:hypothetical protein
VYYQSTITDISPLPRIKLLKHSFSLSSSVTFSAASQHLITTRNSFKSSNMAAASNFYSIVAGVGVGTGR